MVIHAVGSTIRLMTLQRAEFTWLIFSIQGSIAFLPYTIRPLTEKPGGFTGVDQFIGFLVNDINTLRSVIGNTAEQNGVFRHSGENSIKPHRVCFRSNPAAAYVNPHQMPVLMPDPAGNIHDPSAIDRTARCR